MCPPRVLQPDLQVVPRITAILGSRGLSLRQVSVRSAGIYGRATPFFIPHNFYTALRTGDFSPSLCQLLAFSRISAYRLADWAAVFGFCLEDILRFQILLGSKRTILLDSSLMDDYAWTAWFRDAQLRSSLPAIAPLSQLLEAAAPAPIGALRNLADGRFLYAKIGTQDAFAFPDLLPGSIVRVDPRGMDRIEFAEPGTVSEQVFLIEHSRGLCCSRLLVSRKNCVVPFSTHLGFAQVELKLHDEVRLLGTVDAECRSLIKREQPDMAAEMIRRWTPAGLNRADPNPGRLLREARKRMGLSFREASGLSRTIADSLGDGRYYLAPGSLSDYETAESLPRQVHKTISLCSLFGMSLASFLKSAGVALEQAGTEPIPDQFVSRSLAADSASPSSPPSASTFLTTLLQAGGDLPLVLRRSVVALSGMRTHSLQDFFWIGGTPDVSHPALQGGVIVIVNRHQKTPVHSPVKPWWQQPLYLVVGRNGAYACTCCSREGGALVLHSYEGCSRRSDQVLASGDAEVVGQVVAVARKLG